MNRLRNAALAAIAVLASACQGSLSSEPSLPFTPPPNGGVGSNGGAPLSGGSPQANSTPGTVTTQTASYALSAASDGFACVQSNGYGCLLRFNIPTQSSGHAPKAAPSGTPRTPVPSASPVSPLEDAVSNPSASPSAGPTPSGPTMALTMTALPNDAPKMVINSKAPVATTALVRVLLVTSADFTLDGRALAQFTLPQPELVDRGFAVQLFEETVHGKKHTTNAILTIAKSALSGGTLTFGFTAPKLTIPKDRHYLVVLYGDARPATPTPLPSPPSSYAPGNSYPNPNLNPNAPFLTPSPLPTRF